MTRTVMSTLGNPETPDGKIIGAVCEDCGHESPSVDVDHGADAGSRYRCEECGAPVTQTLLDADDE